MSAPVCDWCFAPIGDVAEEFNGGVGHPECVAYVARIVMPHAPCPVYVHRRRWYRQDDVLLAFVERLGHAAVHHGIDVQRLERAIAEAGR
jgi:hypothetical protein